MIQPPRRGKFAGLAERFCKPNQRVQSSCVLLARGSPQSELARSTVRMRLFGTPVLRTSLAACQAGNGRMAARNQWRGTGVGQAGARCTPSRTGSRAISMTVVAARWSATWIQIWLPGLEDDQPRCSWPASLIRKSEPASATIRRYPSPGLLQGQEPSSTANGTKRRVVLSRIR